MALVLKNRVKVTSTTTGTGTFTLGSAVTGYQDFSVISPTSAAWNISDVTYSQNSFSVAGQETAPVAVFFKPDGTKMYVLGQTGDDVTEYDLSTAWDITTASYLQDFSVASQENAPTGLFFKPDGTKMYVCGITGDDVNEYDLSSAWDISTASYLQNFSVSGQETAPQALFFKPDGTKMYIAGSDGDEVNEYDLSSAWNISTASHVQNFSVSSQDITPTGISFKPDGTKMFIQGQSTSSIYQYSLSSAWNISTASYDNIKFTISSNIDNGPTDIFFRPDGDEFFIISSGKDAVFLYYINPVDKTYYFITDGTDFEAGLGGVVPGGAELVRDRVFASSNSNALVNWGAGDKDVVCGYPAEGTPGGIPFCDDSEIGTDLSGWQAFRTALESGITVGVTYDNGGVNGVVSTYSLVYTAGSAYFGGVLAPNGDIHFIPFSANRGEKINYLTGISSTYALVRTAGGSNHYGGVLTPNGDIHFVPFASPVGQKIATSTDVVSTYSLIYTTSIGAYAGGVLSASGEVHFVPSNANRGQKISAAGVVSTYSLVYTTSGAYAGGALAPNGDIHFIPASASVGQKVSASGVVSTYSLVYTAANAYAGGVVASNGDIHFVPAHANRGQKISVTGVVSTYSLVYTNGFYAYVGGVLAPNGDIHFVNYYAAVGQKISVNGVVSTYSLIRTVNGAYIGGVLAPNGDIHFITSNSLVGQKISTNPGKALGPGICLSSFLNKL